MKPSPGIRSTARFALLSLALLCAGLARPVPVLAGPVELATSPMANSTTTPVKPNLMFVLDDSGSMAYDGLPDAAKGFAGKYGFNSSNCNGNTYNPNITYAPPVDSTGAPLNAVATTFNAAYNDGFKLASGTANLNTGFRGGSGFVDKNNNVTSSAKNEPLGPAFYYTYSGTQTTPAKQDYFNQAGTFYRECNSDIGDSPGSSVFTLVRLAAIPTTTITVGGGGAAGSPASINVTDAGSSSNKASVSRVRVTYTVANGGATYDIASGTTSKTSSTSTLAGYIAAKINECKAGNTGICNVSPAGTVAVPAFEVSVSGSKVTFIKWPTAASGATMTVTFATGTGAGAAATVVNFPTAQPNNDVTSVTVGGVQLLNATASANTQTTLAAAINTQINARTATSGYSSAVSNNIVTITGPSSAANLTPALTMGGTGLLTLATLAFPESTPAKLQNFANWYSYYSNRMLMMKTGAGLAFDKVSDAFRVGYVSMNNNVSPDIVQIGTFNPAQRALWFAKLYAAYPSGYTPLREILSRVGQYYAHKIGNVDTYTSTITITGSGGTSVDSVLVGSAELMEDSTEILTSTSALASAILTQINSPQVTDYAASVNANVVTILGPASALDLTPTVTKDGNMNIARTAFVKNTVVSELNGVTPGDPMEYSCQQNFTILSTDGYWTSGNTYNVTNGTVGNVDATASRPYNDGGQANDKTTTTYTRIDYSTSSTKLFSGGANCGSGKKRAIAQPQIQTCEVVTTNGVPGTEDCGDGWENTGSRSYVSPYDNNSSSCVNTPVHPLPDPSVAVAGTPIETPGTLGGVSNTLSDVALYYYQTDLRNPSLGNCTGALDNSVCENNVFISGSDNQTQQHMTTFTLGLGVRGSMVYSSSYLTDTSGDFFSVKLGLTAENGKIVVSGSGNTLVSSIKVDGVELMDDATDDSTNTATVASRIAAEITQNGYSATATGNTVNISGPSTGAGFTPVITKSGSMTITGTAGTGTCPWQKSGTVCNWPQPVAGQPTTTDDLWHTAVNGRGAYFSATDPESLANGLANALTSIKSKVGAAAAAATSTLNPVAGNNNAFVASYTTLKWTGNLEARGINTDTGVVNENATWCVENVAASTCLSPGVVTSDSSGDTTAYFCVTPNSTTCPDGDLSGTDCRVPVATACTGTMNSKVTDTTDSRVIKTANSTGTALIDFGSGTDPVAHAAYVTANAANFDAAKISTLSQWAGLTATQKTAAEGVNLVSYLRGQHGYEISRSSAIDQLYRLRENVLGDALESQPAFIGAPIFSYPYPGYAEFVTAEASRVGTVYMGTNDGMMHGFASDTGSERWAYIPSMVVPNLWKLADSLYSDKHTNYVNGSPVTTDICTLRCSDAFTSGSPDTSPVWKTILVSGLNGGGRGYFALDITDPADLAGPKLLWEFTTTAGIGTVKDDDLGYTFGQPVVTRTADGTWVVLVTSGYDNGTDSATKVSGSFVANSPAGTGEGYLYVLNAATGAIISKISTGAGTAANPSGLAKIAGFNAESGGNKVSYVYGGDLLGNLWRFDVNAGTAASLGTGNVGNGAVLKLATLFSDTAATLPQPVMTTPILGTILGKRIVFVGTGKYLEVPDLSNTQKMTQYAIKDDDATVTLVNPRTTMVQQFLINNPDGSATRLSAATAGATTTGANEVDFGAGRGWFLDFPDSRERVNIDAKLVLGTLVVPSIVPSSTDCSPGGSGWLNFFDYKTGGPVNSTPGISGVKYDSTIVGVNVLFIDGNPIVEVVTSTDPTPSKDDNVQFKATAAGFAGKRVMWRELIPQD